MNFLLSLILTIVGAIMIYFSFDPLKNNIIGSTSGGSNLGWIPINIGGTYTAPNYTVALIAAIIMIAGIILFLFGLWQIFKMVLEKFKGISAKFGKKLEGYESHAASTVKQSGVAQKVSVL